MKCEICGAEIKPGESKCRYCGNEISPVDTEIDIPEKTDDKAAVPPAARYEYDAEEKSDARDDLIHNDVVFTKSKIERDSFCAKCGRPLDGRTGKCVVCDYTAVGQSSYTNNHMQRGNGEAEMQGGNRKKKKKKHTGVVIVLSVLGIMAVFVIAVVAAFYMMGGFNYDGDDESASSAPVTETIKPTDDVIEDATPQVTETIITAPPANVTASPRPAVTSDPSMEPQKGDPAAFKGGSYIYPSHKQVMPYDMIESYAPTEQTARLLYYELFARYGMEFEDDDLSDYFEGQKWYTPNGGKSESKIKAQFNNIEKENEKNISKYMKDNDWD